MNFIRNTSRLEAERRGRLSAALSDGAILTEMKQVLRQHLNAALLECSALTRDLTDLDPDQVMVDLRDQFDPMIETSPIQDAFSDAFKAHLKAVAESGGDWGREGGRLPSGAVSVPLAAE